MPGGPFPPCMAGSAASGTRWDESCHSWHSPIIPHWESSCLACVRANCPVVPAPLTTNGSNPGHYQSEHWTIKGKSVCFVWSFHLPIEIVPSKWYTTLNPERMKVLCFLWRCFPFVWNRQHLQQATKAVQGPESQATKQLASVPAQKKKFWKKHIECWQCKYPNRSHWRSYFIFGQFMSYMHPFEVLRGTLFAHQALGQFDLR